MRAADRAHSISADAVRRPDGRAALLLAVFATLVLLALWRPSVVHAQGPGGRPSAPAANRSHVVRAGETLWGIAARYYGDGHAWTELARANRIATDGGKPPLEVGMKLVVPAARSSSGAKAAATAAAPADSTVPRIALVKAGEGTMPAPPATGKPEPTEGGKAPAGSLAAQTAGKANAPTRAPTAAAVSASSTTTPAPTETLDFGRRQQQLLSREGQVKIGLVDGIEQAAARKASEGRTVFHRDIPDAAEAERRTHAVIPPNIPVPRRGELNAAPYLIAESEHAANGRITARIGALAAELGTYAQRAVRDDEVEVVPPARQRYAVGDRLQAYAVDAGGRKGALVVIPSGVLEVTQVRANGTAVATVREQSARVEQGQHLRPLSGTPAPRATAAPVATPDAATTVLWLDRSQSIPTLQSYLVVGAGAAQGVRAGDEFGLFSQPKGGAEVMVAVARVVRVGADHASVVIVRQRGADIGIGMVARRVARAP